MRTWYVAPATTPAPDAPHHAVICPGAPNWQLVVVARWENVAAELAWEAQPNVTPLHIENWGNTVPAAVVTAFGPWGVVGTDTIRQALQKVRAKWPV